jgi:hypothetical protein
MMTLYWIKEIKLQIKVAIGHAGYIAHPISVIYSSDFCSSLDNLHLKDKI